MLKQCIKVAVVVATSVVAVPYALAVLTNALHGWQSEGGWWKALHPRRVVLLNCALLRKARMLRYARLMLRARWRHSLAPSSRMRKDVVYSSSDNQLDVYYPREEGLRIATIRRPVIIFVHGGTWASGDKSMYSLLCSNLADTLSAVVCCPNFSIYPKGNVDDMIQDIADCVTWVHHNINSHGGDKDRVMLLGHSSGAHLCVMALLELVMKRIIHHPQRALLPPQPETTAKTTDPISFSDAHFDGSNGESGGNGDADEQRPVSSANSGSFYVVDDAKKDTTAGDDDSVMAKSATEQNTSFYVVGDAGEGKMAASDVSATYEPMFSGDGQKPVAPSIDLLEMSLDMTSTVEGETVSATESEERVETELGMVVRRKSTDEADDEDEVDLSQSQREVKDILASIRLVVGLAGMYNITEHYHYECERGVEAYSTMSRAMYGPDQFDRFSPAYIVKNLPVNTALPPIHLMHGEDDTTVLTSSSEHFRVALQGVSRREVAPVTLIPECGHLEICMGLMDPTRHIYGRLMHSLVDLARLHMSSS